MCNTHSKEFCAMFHEKMVPICWLKVCAIYVITLLNSEKSWYKHQSRAISYSQQMNSIFLVQHSAKLFAVCITNKTKRMYN